MLDLKISHDWPVWAAVETRGSGTDREDQRVTTITAVPGQGMSWSVFAGYSSWGCDSGLRTEYSDTEGPVCCSPLSAAECLQLVRALSALLDFLLAGAVVASDPDAWPPVSVRPLDDLAAGQPPPGGPVPGLPGIWEPREGPAGPGGPPAPQRQPETPGRASDDPNPQGDTDGK